MGVSEVAVAIPDERRRCCSRRFRFSFSLRFVLLAFTVIALIAGYITWNVNFVQRRQQLLSRCEKNNVYAVWHWEDSFSGIKDIRSLTIFSLFEGWHERTTDPAVSFIRHNPVDQRKQSLLRRWLGDRRISNLFLTDPTMFAAYRAAFPEAMIVVDPSAEMRISVWERATGSSRRQLTIRP